jgi:Ca-activated chloride channel family protein
MTVTGLVVGADQTTRQDFTVEQTAIEISEIEVVAATNELVPRDEVTSKQRMQGTFTTGLPVDQLNGTLGLQPGVSASQGGGALSMRGGRTNETVTYIDGVLVARENVGTYSRSPTGGTVSVPGDPQVSSNAYEDASVTSGSLSPEFGNSQAGHVAERRRTVAGEEYRPIAENRFLDPRVSPVSTFSIDVDAGSYSNIRRFLNDGMLPPPDAVRIEEMLNYFRYRYPAPKGRHPFTVTMEAGAAPWNPEHQLLLVGLQGRTMDRRAMPPSNLVFLLDVSGSMATADKLPLVKQGFRMLAAQLRPVDRVAIVVYAGAAGLVLPSTPGNDRATILAALDQLEAGGSTAGGAGLQLAYQIALENFLPEGNNRVILATDGDFNVGPSSEAELLRLVEEYRGQGTFLTVLGFGTGNLKDARMEQVADKGNGHYAYIDNLNEARKVFVRELGGTLHAIAKDVKLQIEFNPARVASYRLVGYENRVLAREDFDDDTKDAGELGAGHSVTALYEVIPASREELAADDGGLRYQLAGLTPRARMGREWLTVDLRYKLPAGTRSILLTEAYEGPTSRTLTSQNFRWASAVAEFGMLLRNSSFRGNASAESVLARAETALDDDEDGDRTEFLRLVRQYQELRYRALR